MSTAVRDLRNTRSADPWRQRVEAGDWDAITAEIDEYGGALLPPLLTAGETARIRSLYTDDGLFRRRAADGGVDMVTDVDRAARETSHRFPALVRVAPL